MKSCWNPLSRFSNDHQTLLQTRVLPERVRSGKDEVHNGRLKCYDQWCFCEAETLPLWGVTRSCPWHPSEYLSSIWSAWWPFSHSLFPSVSVFPDRGNLIRIFPCPPCAEILPRNCCLRLWSSQICGEGVEYDLRCQKSGKVFLLASSLQALNPLQTQCRCWDPPLLMLPITVTYNERTTFEKPK